MASSWKISFRPRARRELATIPFQEVRSEAIEALVDLRLDPFGPQTAPLEWQRLYRKVYLSRGYRMIYTVAERSGKIFIDRIRPHDAAYSGFGD